jgi:LmbE family N-acetylglucosaminyl deacetylase
MKLERGDLGRTVYTDVYLSPHLDDVVFCCAGSIATQVHRGDRALVVTAFSGSNHASPTPLKRSHAPFLEMARRREEDANAMHRLGVDYVRLGYEEAIFRHPTYGSLIGLTSRVLGSDASLCHALHSDILEICQRTRTTRLYVPLAVGHHVDHQILFEIGARIAEHRPLGCEVRCYEDVPYVFIPYLLRRRLVLIGTDCTQADVPRDVRGRPAIGAELLPIYRGILGVKVIANQLTVIQRLLLLVYLLHALRTRNPSPPNRLRLIPEVLDLTAYVSTKLDAVAQYASQVTALFGDIEVFRQRFETYSALIGPAKGRYFERYWRAERLQGGDRHDRRNR